MDTDENYKFEQEMNKLLTILQNKHLNLTQIWRLLKEFVDLDYIKKQNSEFDESLTDYLTEDSETPNEKLKCTRLTLHSPLTEQGEKIFYINTNGEISKCESESEYKSEHCYSRTNETIVDASNKGYGIVTIFQTDYFRKSKIYSFLPEKEYETISDSNLILNKMASFMASQLDSDYTHVIKGGCYFSFGTKNIDLSDFTNIVVSNRSKYEQFSNYLNQINSILEFCESI